MELRPYWEPDRLCSSAGYRAPAHESEDPYVADGAPFALAARCPVRLLGLGCCGFVYTSGWFCAN
jgi:hypothetical protein